MKVKYFSEVLNKYFDSEKELNAAEKAENTRKHEIEMKAQKALETRKLRVKELETAREKSNASAKVAREDKEAYRKLLEEFCKDYPDGYHQTYHLNDLHDLFTAFWNF